MGAVNMRHPFFLMDELNDFLPYVNGSPLGEDMNGSFLESWLYPGIVQQRELGQSLQGQRYLNRHTMQDKMSDAKKAGINPHVAAQGIAGASSASPSSSSAVPAGSAGVASLSEGLQASSSAIDSGVNVYEKFSLTSIEYDRRKAEMSNLLAAAFHNEWLGRAVAEMLPLQKDNERADTWLKLANFDKARSEKKLFDEQCKVEHERIDQVKKDADLLEAQGNYVKALELKTQAETDGIKLDNDKKQFDKDFRDKWHFDNTKPIDNALIEAMAFEEGEALGAVNTIGKSIETISYNERHGFNSAEIEDAFDKAYNTGLGNEAVAAEYSKMKYQIDIAKMAVKYYLEALASGAKDPASFVIQKLMVPSLKEQSEIYESDVKKPTPVPRSRN